MRRGFQYKILFIKIICNQSQDLIRMLNFLSWLGLHNSIHDFWIVIIIRSTRSKYWYLWYLIDRLNKIYMSNVIYLYFFSYLFFFYLSFVFLLTNTSLIFQFSSKISFIINQTAKFLGLDICMNIVLLTNWLRVFMFLSTVYQCFSANCSRE